MMDMYASTAKKSDPNVTEMWPDWLRVMAYACLDARNMYETCLRIEGETSRANDSSAILDSQTRMMRFDAHMDARSATQTAYRTWQHLERVATAADVEWSYRRFGNE